MNRWGNRIPTFSDDEDLVCCSKPVVGYLAPITGASGGDGNSPDGRPIAPTAPIAYNGRFTIHDSSRQSESVPLNSSKIRLPSMIVRQSRPVMAELVDVDICCDSF
jgi:hypothetical protein